MGQYVPSGSYKQTSRDINVTLSAECKKIDGSWQSSTLDLTNLDNADVVNIDGVLKIEPSSYLPGGNYIQTSRDINVILSAECKKIDGSWQSSTLNLTNLNNADVVNVDGVLTNQGRT